MAFSQLLIAGLALAQRFEDSRVVKTVTKEVPTYVTVRVPTAKSEPDRDASVVARPPLSPTYLAPTLPAPTPVATPKIADPRTERLVTEARKARVAGDMGLAIMKLEEALNQSPEEVNVHYELGLVHEQMGVFDTASAHFEKVFQLGASVAGSLYELAAGKLRDGFTEPDNHGKLSLGRVRIFKDPDTTDGQRVILTIPVNKAPGEEIVSDDLGVSVYFFNRSSNGEIVQLEKEYESWAKDQWVSLPFDWASDGETVRMTYTIPPQDLQTEHLYGERTYYGQIVTLEYQGQILDLQAWPPGLAARMPQSPTANPMLPEFQDSLPEFDPNLPLLPPLPYK